MTVNILSLYKKTWPDGKFSVSYLHDSVNCERCLQRAHQATETKDASKKQGYDPPDDENSSKGVFRQKLIAIEKSNIPDNLFTSLGLQLTASEWAIQKFKPNYNKFEKTDACDKKPNLKHLPKQYFIDSCKVKKCRIKDFTRVKNETKQLKKEKRKNQLKSETKQLKREKVKKQWKNERTKRQLKNEMKNSESNKVYIKYRPLLKDPVVKIYTKNKNSPPTIHFETPISLPSSPAETETSFEKSIPFKKSISHLKIASSLKEPTKGTLKRKRWKLEKLQQININYEDDLFEDQNLFNFPITQLEDNMDSDQYEGMRTPNITLSPVTDSRNSPVCNDCYSPGEFSSTRRGAEEYMHRREKRRSKKLLDETSGSENSSPEKPQSKEDTTRDLLNEASEMLKKVAEKKEKQEEKDSDEEEDEYFTDTSDSSD